MQDDAISVEDIDKVMKDGLGMRYAFLGPLETCHLNAEGLYLSVCLSGYEVHLPGSFRDMSS